MIKPYLLVPIAIVMPLLWLRRAHYSRLGLAGRMLAFLIALVAAQAVLSGSAQANVPSIAAVSPSHGPAQGGQQVTISGSGFVGQGGVCNSGYRIWFGTDLANGYAISPSSYQVLSDSQIRVVVPPNFGGPVDVRVHNACGTSAISGGDQFTYDYPASQCLSGSCSVTVSGTAVGPLGHVAEGFLDGLNTDAGVAITPGVRGLVDALHPRQWRFGQAGLGEPGGGVFGLARGAGAQITLDLTSDWQDWAYTHDRRYYQTPYGDLSTYGAFIANDVRQRMTAGQVPDYFDVWNEPVTTGTVNQWLSVYGTAYRAIKSVDASAAVEGPSIPTFLVTSANQGDTPGYELSLTDFFNWEMSSGVRFAAVSWHEDGTTVQSQSGSAGNGFPGAPLPGGYRDYWSPNAIAAHVTAAKALIAQYPALRGTQVFVNEYGPTYAVNIPGWMVGDFGALETAGADQAMMTCATSAACTNLLDGLIGTDGAPQMPYWVMKAYAQMSGPRVGTLTSGSNVYALASRNDATHVLSALIGRADDCWGGQQCPQFHSVSAAAVSLAVSAAVPWGVSTVDVTVQPLRNSASNALGANDVRSAPPAVTLHAVPVRCGVVKIPIASAGNGDAFAVTITASGAGLGSARATAPGHGTRAPAVNHLTRAPALPVGNCVASATRSRRVAVSLRRVRTHTRTRRTHRRAPRRR